MSQVVSLFADLLPRLALWLLFAIPLLAVLTVIIVFLRRRRAVSIWEIGVLAIIVGILLAPMPLGMFVALVPNGYLIVSGLGDYLGYLSKVGVWFAISLSMTFVIVAFCLELLLAKHRERPRRKYHLIKRCLFAGICLLSIGVVSSLFLPTDDTCHNVFRDGRTSISAKIKIDIEIANEDWPEITSFYREFAGKHELSFREGDSEDSDEVKLLHLSMCSEDGVTISTNEQRWRHLGYRHVIPGHGTLVSVYQIESDTEWQALSRELIAELRRAWPGKVRFRGKNGQFIEAPL